MRWLIVHPGPQFSVADVYTGWVEALRALGEDVLEYNLDKRLQVYDAALVETGNVDAAGHPEVRKLFTREQAIHLAADRLFGDCMKWWPHVVLGVSAFFVSPWYLDVMRDRGIKTVLLHTESPYQDDEQMSRGQFADLNLLNDPVNLDLWNELDIPAVYMPHAYDPDIHYPNWGERKTDFSFVGTLFKSRAQFFSQMDFEG
ncbi:MAG TPA: hypothetical protein VGH57_16785, partial [Amycolatopsis sp.]